MMQNLHFHKAPATLDFTSKTQKPYDSFGGCFAFSACASAEVDHILFAHRASRRVTVSSVSIQACVIGAQSRSEPTVLQWSLAVGETAIDENPRRRTVLGMQYLPKSASVGDPFTPEQLVWTHKPFTCYENQLVHVLVRVISGNPTADQITRGVVIFDDILV